MNLKNIIEMSKVEIIIGGYEMEIIDAKGLACPKPVVLAKKALAEHEKFIVVVDNRTAVENLTKLGKKMKAAISVVEESEIEFKVKFTAAAEVKNGTKTTSDSKAAVNSATQKTYFIASDTMGDGDEKLGRILIKGFLSTIKELDPLPQKIIFVNSGVKLAILEADIIKILEELEDLGVKILLCGTCVDFFGLKDQLQVGEISNMYEIADSLNKENIVKV